MLSYAHLFASSDWLHALIFTSAVGFWGLVILANAILVYCSDNNCGKTATATIVVFCLILHFLVGINLIEFVMEYWLHIVLVFAGNIALGAGYATLRWRHFVLKNRRLYQKVRTKYLRDHNLMGASTLTDAQKTALQSDVAYYSRNVEQIETNNDVENHKSRLALWVLFPLWSATWLILSDPLMNLSHWVVESIRESLQRYSERQWADVQDDFNIPSRR